MTKNKAAQALGKLGGKVKSKKKALAARKNGKKGGRPPKVYRQEIAEKALRELDGEKCEHRNTIKTNYGLGLRCQDCGAMLAWHEGKEKLTKEKK